VEPQDAAPQNNRYPVVVKIVRDTIRVLQVCGSPSYDQKFLRLFLKQDPSVDLVSFFILRTNEDMDAGWSSDELSLIAFPYIQLFSEELQSFDLVLFQNFNYGPYFMSDANYLLGNIADFVLEGKAFVMTGGDRSFDLGEYVNTPIAEILPVQLGVSGSVSSEEQFLPRLTKGGVQHPITKLSSNPTDNQRIWSDLSKMDGFNRNNGLVPGAASLLAHPTEKTTSGAAMPILAVREVGKGRVMSLNVDSSWRWSFSEAVEGSGNQAYLRFWKNSLQWLVGDPEDRRVVISPERENAQIGEEMDIVFRSRDSSYRPIAKAKIKGHIRTPKGEKIKFEHVTGELGEVAMGYTPEEQGTYYIKANYKGDVAETVFAATARDPELLDLHPKKEWMKRLVEYYDGQYSTSYQAPLIDSKALRMIPERNRVKLGYAPAVGLWVALFSALAIWFRRRGGRP
ncbi:MAG: glutamine amidotransferase, partial [Myxococcota bacterium]|nr:glutamine amidotransferase [Myxococcota bacterium]